MTATASRIGPSGLTSAMPADTITVRRSTASPPRPAGPDIEIIDGPAAFRQLQREWNALQNSAPGHQTCFQSHAWLSSWLQIYVADQRQWQETVAIITIRRNGILRVVCPLAVRRSLGLTQLTWLGEPASQYGDVITDGSAESLRWVSEAMDFAIAKLKPDTIYLRKVRSDAAIAPWLAATGAVPADHDEAPYLDFRGAGSLAAYCEKYSAKSRKNRRRLRRRLEENGTVTTTVLPAGEPAREAVALAIAFKQQWLVERGEVSSALRDNSLSAQLARYVAQPGDGASPFVSIMHSGTTPVSVQFGIIMNNRLALHMIAYNPETEKTGAGVLHIEDTIAHCFETGLDELDFLAPNAAYKQAWADAAVAIADHVVACTAKGRLFAQGYLCSTRTVLKSKISQLPLGVRRSIARRLEK